MVEKFLPPMARYLATICTLPELKISDWNLHPMANFDFECLRKEAMAT